MFNKILLATDGHENSKNAMEYALEMSKKLNSELIILHTYYLPDYFNAHESSHYTYLRELKEQMFESGEKLLSELKSKFDSEGIKVETVLEKSLPGPAIVQKAESENCDLIIIGTRGLSTVTSLLISSVSNYVIHHTKCPVLLIH